MVDQGATQGRRSRVGLDQNGTPGGAAGNGGPGGRLFLVAAAALLVVGLVLTSVIINRKETLVAEWRARLSSAADDRKGAVEVYLYERITDALLIAAFPSVRERLEAGQVPDAHLLEIMELARDRSDYRSIVLLSRDLTERARVGEPPPSDLAALLGAGGTPVGLVGFGGASRAPLVAAAAPVSGRSGEVVGWVAVLSDGRRDLSPSLRRESVPTRSAESLLVVRSAEGLELLFPTRQTQAGSRPRGFAAAKAARTGEALSAEGSAVEGKETFGGFLDHRGVPVFAATRFLAGPRWGLVVKIDRDEALAPLWKDIGWAFAVFSCVVLAGLALVRSVRKTERWKSVEAAGRQAERYHLVFEEARDAILWVRPSDGRILEANHAAEKLWGYGRAELLARTVSDLRSDEESAGFERELAAAREDGVLFRTSNVRKGGERFPLEISARSVDLAGEDVVISVARDVTENVAAFDRIVFLNRLLRMISGVNQALVKERDVATLLARVCQIVVEDGDFVMAWVGVPDRASGSLVPIVSAGAVDGYFDEVRIAASDVPEGKGPSGIAFREGRTVVVQDWETDERIALWREAGRARGYRASASCAIFRESKVVGILTLYAGRPWVLTPEVIGLLEEMAGDIGFALAVADGDERRTAAEEQVLRLNAELEERVRDRTAELEVKSRELETKSRQLETFSYSVSHDLRAPLRAIDGYSRLLEEQATGRLSEAEMQLLGRIRGGTRRMAQLIDDLLAFSRAGKLALKPRLIDVAEMVGSILADVLQERERARTDLRLGFLPPVVADPALLRQVFENLLSNAVKFSSKRERRLIEVEGWREDGWTVYRVRDNGVGFDPEQADKLFVVFERLHGRDFEGTGIGLALVRRIVEQHGGKVGASSIPEEGASFTISLPDREA